MESLQMQARLLVQEALLKALCMTRREPEELAVKFAEFWMDELRHLNQEEPVDPDLARAVREAVGHFAPYLK